MTQEETSYAELRLIADAVPTHLLHLDREERILFANKAAAQMWGRAPEDMAGHTIREILGEEAQSALAPYTQRVLQGETAVYEAPFEAPDGTTRYFQNCYVPERGPGGEVIGFVVTGTDITDHKRVQAALAVAVEREAASRQQLERERVARELFVSMVTHDMRTPMTAARVSAELAMRRAEDPAAIRKLAARTVGQLDRIDLMLRDVLDATRIRSGGEFLLMREEVDLRELLSEVLLDLGTIHGDRFVLKAPGPVTGRWDSGGLRRMIENLCSNALKYGRNGTPVTVKVSEDPALEEVRISVHNEGVPIPAEEVPRLFEPFSRAPAAESGGKTGWGLGLTLVKGIVDAHGGSVTVTSDEGGTTFLVRLPRAPADAGLASRRG